MQSKALTVSDYLNELPEDRKEPMERLRQAILKNLPKGFTEQMSYGMIGYVVPHSLYPKGYHCDPKLPLPLINLGSQKNFIALHHLGIYASEQLVNWFTEEYPKHSKSKLDMGKGCIRFKKMNDIPYDLVGELVTKMNVEDWIKMYEEAFVNKSKKAK
jgi:uncharacterized protein YdhG (YjbR/CyaY superfamily)